jgi:hypothetical protein
MLVRLVIALVATFCTDGGAERDKGGHFVPRKGGAGTE